MNIITIFAGLMVIPKIIHYCWFGGNPLPKNLKKYIDGWKEKLPDYDIIEWNETNFDIDNSIPYVKEAYAAKKFAFVSDYVRIWALFNYGGVYFDTDVEVLRPFDQYLKDRVLVFGFEFDRLLTTAFIACSNQNAFIKEFLESYNGRRFILEDGRYDMSTINEHLSNQAERWGVDLNKDEEQIFGDGLITYPQEIFSGFDVKNWHPKITEKTCTVHHMAASWVTSKKKFYFGTIFFLQKILGYKLYDKLKSWFTIKFRKNETNEQSDS